MPSARIRKSASAQANKQMANYRHAAKGGFMGGGARGSDRKEYQVQKKKKIGKSASRIDKMIGLFCKRAL